MTEAPLKPGQKYPTPTPGFGDRVFYETLLRQKPESEMAQEWCVAYGVLPPKRAKKLFAVIQERKKTGKGRGGGSSSPVPPESSKRQSNNNSDDELKKKKKKKKRARVLNDEVDDPDLARSSGAEHVGKSSL